MFDIIKDLKENIQKNNMKKLMLSAVLGMFCCCTNNAMEEDGKEEPQIKEIIDVLGNMIEGQVKIFNAKEAIKEKEKKIYTTIKDENGKVTKGNLLKFIKEQFSADEESFTVGISFLEQYFHLEKINEDEECTRDKLTEIFWEEQEVDEKIDEVEDDITDYLIEIATSEEIIRDCFQEYYEVKIKEGKEKQKEEIIDEIMNECRGETKTENLHKDFLVNLGRICDDCKQLKEIIGNKKDAILEAIQRRITLDEEITEDALKSFIRKKIGIEETKKVEPEEEKKNSQKGGKPAKEECCPCCDCWGKKKNQVEDENQQVENENSKEKPVKIYNNP